MAIAGSEYNNKKQTYVCMCVYMRTHIRKAYTFIIDNIKVTTVNRDLQPRRKGEKRSDSISIFGV